MSESLYFIAIIPPPEVSDQLMNLKYEIRDKFGSKHALNSPPHITLHMPFKWKDKRYSELEEVMQNLNNSLAPFDIALEGFDFFEPRVVFVDVVENGQLNELQEAVVYACRRSLKLDNANYKNRPFHPHVTIGFRDLKKTQFFEAKQEFELRKASFTFHVERVELLKHDGKKWEVI